ncbi:hypothetical protein BC936DRAFT_138012 [Jimgerdemannia flammicorona]|uniref:RING-type domain-containing protein n=1 Tax=Jimgerdemannia flammicorona TaxID=994334 RepID=A0A433DIT6_9FUNG|nr:hypothetical protein BC936DRAFT_138012 [Jimgerdemannia flammicorona]
MSTRLQYNLTREREARRRQQELSDLMAARQIQDVWNQEDKLANRRQEEQDKIIALKVTCPICLEQFVNPKAVIYCGHTICGSCFEAYCKTSMKNEQIQCHYYRCLLLIPVFTQPSCSSIRFHSD